MPISDSVQIEYLLRGCDIEVIHEVLKDVMEVEWVQ